MTAGGPRREPVQRLAEEVIAGDRTALARAITLVESRRRDHRQQAGELLERLLPRAGGAHRIGISGVPGVGKSTFIETFGTRLTGAGHRVAVLAVDPSSALSKGSILGDKTRMARLAADQRAFIRPSPSRGSLGGVAGATREAILVCEAAGFDVVLVETVGVGQSETLVAEMVDSFLVLMLPGAGDELQGIKRGIVELADVVAVNKADGETLLPARRARAELETVLAILRPAREEGWAPRVLAVSALTGDGLDELWRTLEEHRAWLGDAGRLAARREGQRVRWMWALVDDALAQAVRRHPAVAQRLAAVEDAVRSGTVSPSAAAGSLLDAFGLDWNGSGD